MILDEKKAKVKEMLKQLYKLYPEPKTALYYTTPFELLVATIMSAQATDKLVNTITPGLFKKYPSAQAFAHGTVTDIDKDIQKVNFHTNKAKNIHATAKIIAEEYNGKVPETMEELDALPGVARKTANVVLGNAFHKAEGVVVDTHVMRLAQKFGLTNQKTPEKIEQDLMQIVPKDKWIDFSHLLINFGREYCPARPHNCKEGPLGGLLS